MQNLDLMKKAFIKHIMVNGGLPDFTITDPTVAGYVEKLSTFSPTMDATSSPEEYVVEVLNGYSQNIDVISEHILNNIDTLAEALSERINKSYTEINDVRVQVSDIESSYTETLNRLVASDPFLIQYYEHGNDDKSVAHGLGEVDWEEINMVSSVMDIVSFCHDLTKTSLEEPSFKLLGTIALKLKSIEVPDTTPLILKKQYADTVIHAVIDNFDVTYDDTEMVLKTLLTPTRVNTFVKKWTNQLSATKDMAQNTTEIANMVRIYKPTVDGILEHSSTLGPDAIRLIEDNAEVIKGILYGCAYNLIIMRNNIFNDTLIMQNRTVNMDNYSPFIADGHTDKEILQHLFVKFPNDRVLPELGIASDVVVRDTKMIEDKYSVRMDDISSKVSFLKKKYETAAFNTVMFSWERDIKTNHEGDPILPQSLNRCVHMAKAQRNSEAPLNTVLTNLVFGVTAPESFGYTLYKRLDSSFVDYLSNLNGTQDEDIVKRINSAVVTDIVIDFLKQMVIDPKK